jgi:bifunctional UDP-N-acetylglucosamine pyrophosphorylase/glucosamine-1-phosphate N-acetyltransferase
VEIAGGAYIGAGSVITDNVPAEALALGRARQVVKEGWKKRRKSQASSGAPVAPERA